MIRIYLLVIVLFYCFFPLFAQMENIPLITVHGESTIKVKPDYVILTLKIKRGFKIEGKEEDFCSAFEIFCKEDTKIKLFGFDEKNIDVSIIQIENSIYIKEVFIYIKDLSKLEKYILEIHKLGFKDYINIDYRVSNINEYKNKCRNSAISAAKIKASALANELGQKIGKAHFIEEADCEDYNWYNNRNIETIKNITYKIGSDDYLVDPGYITFTSKIKVSFDLQK